MKNIFYISIMFFACLILNASCKKSTNEPDVLHSVQLPANADGIVAANSNFAFDFFHANLQTDVSSSNKLISPLSIYFALSMLYNGADGATKDSIQYALRLQGISIDYVNNTCKALLQQMPLADNKVNLSIANSIWYDNKSLQPLQSFLDVNSGYYNAAIKGLDFGIPSSLNTINDWISQQTHGKINNVLNSLKDMLYLINAVYFKGDWMFSFDKKATTNAPFTTSGGSFVSTSFMNMKQTLRYLNNDTLQMVELPYGGGNFNMYVLLPDNKFSINQFATVLNKQTFTNWQSKLDSTNLNLYLPKFTYAYSIDNMKPELSLMGMGIAFTDRADFSKMYKASTQIGTAIHKTYIKVDETGTEAAAVTVIGITITCPSAPPTMQVNRPFVYVIQEKTSSEILFIGMVNNPAAS